MALLLALVLAVAAGFWAGRSTLGPVPSATGPVAPEVVAVVSEQSVGRQLTLNVSVAQPRRLLAANGLSGVVTQVSKPGSVNQGDVLYRVAQVPVRVVQGDVPFYRPLQQGAAGADVRQLETALVALGLLDAADETFSAYTTEAVKAWQTKLGMPASGTVALGELVAVPKLPAALLLDDKQLAVGVPLSGGEKIVFGAAGTPSFELVVTDTQARLIPAGAPVTMSYQGKTWSGIVAGSTHDDNGQVRLQVTAPAGGPVCGADCGLVSTGSEVSILSQVSIVPPASGPAVPVAALRTQPDGSGRLIVVDASGGHAERTVKVLGSQDGVAVVSGVRSGERVVVLPATASGPAGGGPSPSPSR